MTESRYPTPPTDDEIYERITELLLLSLMERVGGTIALSVDDLKDAGRNILMVQGGSEEGFKFTLEANQ